MSEPLHIDITALKEGWGYFVSFGDEKDWDGVQPTLLDAIKKIIDISIPKNHHTTAIAPTCDEICNELLTEISSEAQTGWRHGVDKYNVYHRESDNTYWGVSFRLSTDGETNELREGTAQISRVYPRTVIKTDYYLNP